MNYYKIKRSIARQMGINLFAHRVSTTLCVVSDRDLKHIYRGMTSQEIEEHLNIQPLTAQQLAQVNHDSHYTIQKSQDYESR